MPTTALYHPVLALLKQNRHRALIVLNGSLAWQVAQLQALCSPTAQLLWAGNVPDEFMAQAHPIQPSQYGHLLGQETDWVIMDSRAGYSANGFGILAGLIKAGGGLVFLTSPSEDWANLPNPETQRFLNTPLTPELALPYFGHHVQKTFAEHALWLNEHDSDHQALASMNLFLSAHTRASRSSDRPPPSGPTADQQQAIERIHHVGFGHRKRPLVMTADRGRGKTTALGLGAIDLLLKGKQHIVLTASRLDQVNMAFEQACLFLKNHVLDARLNVHKPGWVEFTYNNQLKTLSFIAPDQLILQPTLADVLMVDEAAHLPTSLLTDLLKRHHRIVFATTLQGYEGSGRGFELRFKKALTTLTPNWKEVHLTIPIRWACHDPLETAINQTLLLNRQPNQTPDSLAQEVQVVRLSARTLADHPHQLQAVFNLLVQAHYQTTPNDLQQLLSVPNSQLFIAQSLSHVVGVTWCIEEGNLPHPSAHLHGHLVPQLLVNHYSQTSFLRLSTWRIMRIAVHPQHQHNGVGKAMLNAVKQSAQDAQIDYLCSSFGATDALVPFWFKQGYVPLHVGVKRDKASGCHTVVVGQALTALAQQSLAGIGQAFQKQFPHVLMESLPYFSANLVLAVLSHFAFKQQKPQLKQALHQYQTHQRSYEAVSGQLWAWSLRHAKTLSLATEQQRLVWCDKVLKKRPWQDVAHTHHLAGRKGVETVLKALIQNLHP